MDKIKRFQQLMVVGLLLAPCLALGVGAFESPGPKMTDSERSGWRSFQGHSLQIFKNPTDEDGLTEQIKEIKNPQIRNQILMAKFEIDLLSLPATLLSSEAGHINEHTLDRPSYRARLLELYMALLNWTYESERLGVIDRESIWKPYVFSRMEDLLVLMESGYAPVTALPLKKDHIESILEPTIATLFKIFVTDTKVIGSEYQRLEMFAELNIEVMTYPKMTQAVLLGALEATKCVALLDQHKFTESILIDE